MPPGFGIWGASGAAARAKRRLRGLLRHRVGTGLRRERGLHGGGDFAQGEHLDVHFADSGAVDRGVDEHFADVGVEIGAAQVFLQLRLVVVDDLLRVFAVLELRFQVEGVAAAENGLFHFGDDVLDRLGDAGRDERGLLGLLVRVFGRPHGAPEALVVVPERLVVRAAVVAPHRDARHHP
jgi:hypothetical protein